jgi:hypothetical protein
MPTLEALRAELGLLSLDQLREYRANDYAESLTDYSKQELRELVYDMWTKDGCKPLAAMTNEEILAEIMDDLDDESTEDDIKAFLDAVRKYAVEGDPTE